MNSITSIHAAEIARQQTARNEEAARTYTQRHAAQESSETSTRRAAWRVRWHYPARAGIVS
ncbi:MAG: hypothetical protein ABIQ59_01310 [Nocardioidaceae bacterium]